MAHRAVDVVIVGGGVMGCSAAYHLAKEGRPALLIEQFAVGHGRGSSHGPSRIIRLAYPSRDYLALARASYALWRALEDETGECLLVQTGGLDIGSPDALGLDDIRRTYRLSGVPHEELDRQAIMGRFPQLNLATGTIGLYQGDYGILAADRCVATLAARARRHGAIFREGERVRRVRVVSDGVEVHTDRGTYAAARLILTAGSWTRPLLRQLDLDLPLTVRKEQLAFFRADDPQDVAPGRLPLVIHRFPGTTTLGSVFPTFGHPGVKVMVDRIGPAVPPDDPDRSVDEGRLARLTAYATDLLPGLTGEVIEAISCRYTMAPDEDFVVDRHPGHPQVAVAAPCSGHGFKFAVVIGRILADLAIEGATGHDVARFRIDRPALAVA